jgi:hypothetical protein
MATRFPQHGFYLLEIHEAAFDALTAEQKQQIKAFINEVGLQGGADDEVGGTSNQPDRMTNVILPTTGKKRFARIEAVIGDPADPLRMLSLAEVKTRFVTKLAAELELPPATVDANMTFTVFGDIDGSWGQSRQAASDYLLAKKAMWGWE